MKKKLPKVERPVTPAPKVNLAKIQEELDFARKNIGKLGAGAEGFLISVHVVRDKRIHHSFIYGSFPNNDWGACMIAMGTEARKAELLSRSGATTI